MITQFLNPCHPVAFKRVFGTESNKAIVLHFLNAIFEGRRDPIKNITFLETAQGSESAALKTGRVEVLCEDAYKNKKIVVMQVSEEAGFEKPSLYCAAKMYIDLCEKGTECRNCREMTFVTITDRNVFPDNSSYLHHYAIVNLETRYREPRGISYALLEVRKFKKDKERLNHSIQKWAYFFKHADATTTAEVPIIAGKDEIITRAYRELDPSTWSNEALKVYASMDVKCSVDEIILEAVRVQSLEEGVQKGRETESIKIAKQLHACGVEAATIEKATQISQEILEPLLK